MNTSYCLSRLSMVTMVLFFASLRDVRASTVVTGGILAGDTTWDTASETYVIDNVSYPVTVPSGVTLTIGDSTTVESKYDNKKTIVVEAGGTLVATGATFQLKTRDGLELPPILVNGTSTFTDCALTISQSVAEQSDTTVLLLVENTGSATLSGTSLAASTSGIRVSRGVWVRDTATLTVNASASNRSSFYDFPYPVWWGSSSAVSIAGADFSDGTYGVTVNDAAVDVTVSDSTFTNYDRALNLPQAEDISLTNITITQDTGTIDGQIGVYTRDYTSFAISGAISNMYIGVHVSLAHQADGTAAVDGNVTFTGCDRDLLAEGDYAAAGGTISSNTTLTEGHYHVDNPITIAAGVTLTIEPGVILDTKRNDQSMFVVDGTLAADQAIFEAHSNAYPWLLQGRNSGTVDVSKCEFRGASTTDSDYYTYTRCFIGGTNDAVIRVKGCQFNTAPSYFGDTSYIGRLMHAIRVEGDATVTVDEAPDGTRSSMSGFYSAVYHRSRSDLVLDKLDISDCRTAIDCDTIANLFLYNTNMTDNSTGLYLLDAGVVVTNNVSATNTPNAFYGTMSQILSPQIGLSGMSFDENSYCRVQGGYTFLSNATMPVLPIRIDDRYGRVVIPAGVTVTFPTGSRLSNWQSAGEYRALQVLGTLNCTGVTMEFWTYNDRFLILVEDSGKVTFTDCDVSCDDTYSSAWWGCILYASGNSQVTIAGSDFVTSTDQAKNTSRVIRIVDNADVTVKDFDGTPSTFANFQRPIEAYSIATCPVVKPGTVFAGDVLEYACLVTPGGHHTISADKAIECANLTIDDYYRYIVSPGVTVEFLPGTTLRTIHAHTDNQFEIQGTLQATDVTFDLKTYAPANDSIFWCSGNGVAGFTNCSFTTYETYTNCYDVAVIGATDNGSVTLDGCTFTSDAARPTFRALKFYGTSSLNVVDGANGKTTITGFVEAIHAPDLDVLGSTPGLMFGDNVRDIRFDGGTTITGDIVFPADSVIGAYVYYDPATIAPGASVTFPMGCVLDNYKVSSSGDFDVFVVQGSLTMTGVTCNVRTYCEDNGYTGTRLFDIEGNGTGVFTDCAFFTGDDYQNIRQTTLIAVSDNGLATVRGGSFESDAKYWDYPTSHAITLFDKGKLSVSPYNQSNTTFRGFPRAITVFTSTGVDVSVEQALFRENGIGFEVVQAPLKWYLSGTTFIGNSTAAVYNSGDSTLDCRNNYWGHPSGPNHPSNPFGLGDKVVGDVLFIPYAATGLVTITIVGDHPVGQVPNAFTTTGNIDDAVLLRFSLASPEGTVPVSGFTVRLPQCQELDNANFANVLLVADTDTDGAFSGARSDVTEAVGVIDTAAKTLTFSQDMDLEGDWLIVADLVGIASGDALSLRLDAEDILSDPDLFLSGACSAAKHYRDRLFIGDHSRGRVSNGLLAATDQSDIHLTALSTSPGYFLQSISVFLSGSVGITAENLKNVTLLVDADGDGEESYGEAIWPASLVQLSGTTGQIDFAFGDSPLATGTDLVVRCDFVDLRRDDQLTVQVTGLGVTPVDPLVDVVGENAGTTHIVPRPMLILDPAFQATDGFTAASILRNVPLLGFTIFPGGRQVREVTFSLAEVDGIDAADITNARLRVDINGDGVIGDGETGTVGGAALVDIDEENRTGTITFSEAFTVAGGDFLLMADVANLANDDMLTICLRSQNVSPGPNDTIEGGITPVRHAVIRADLPTAAEQHNWTLTYRSPGGTSVTGTYSHDGTKVILGYSAGTAYLFDSDDNRPLLMLHKHYDKVQYAGFSADDSLAITVTYDGAVYLWDAETGELERNLFSDLLVRYATASPDVSKLFIVTEGKALLLDMETGHILWTFVTGTSGDSAILYGADYSPDGTMILVGAGDKRTYLLDASDGSIIRYFQSHSEAVTGVAFAGNGTRVLTTSPDGTVGIWNTTDNVNPIDTVSLDGENAMGATGTVDGSRIAILSYSGGNRYLHMLDGVGLHKWAVQLPWQHYTDKFSSISFSDDGSRILICSNAYNDWNYPAAIAVQYSATTGEFLGFVGPRGRIRGWDWGQLEQRVRVSEDGERIFFMNSEGLDVIFTEPGKSIVQSSEINGEEAFDVTPDGRKLVHVYHQAYNDDRLRFYAVDEDRLTLINSNNVAGDYAPLTLSRTGSTTIYGDQLVRTLSGQVLANSPNDDGGYRSAFSPNETLWGIAFYDNMSIKTMLKSDASGSLEYGVTLTDPYKPRKILYHPDGERVGCVDRYSGVQFYRLDNNDPVGLYDYRSGGSIPRIYDAALSHDGTMLAVARGNSVRLFDMRTGRVLRYFYPTHSDQATCYALSVGFGSTDSMLYVSWSDNYVEIFERSRLESLRVDPVTRTLPVGRSQTYSVRALYDDGSSADVTPYYIYSADGVELAPGSRLYANPADAVTIEADLVTVKPGASGAITITAVFSEGGITRSASAVLTVGDSPVIGLRAEPSAISLSKGVVQPIRYFAQYADGYEEEVTRETDLTADPADKVRLAGNNVTILGTATPGDIYVEGTYTFDGVTRTATTVVSLHAPESRWVREWCTAGGDVACMTYSPNGQRLAVGYSSGAIGLYAVGATPTQYELEDVIPAHERPVTYIHFVDDDTAVSIGGDGLVLQWDLTAGSGAEPITQYLHDAAITAAAFIDEYAAIGDNLGRVMLYNLDENAMSWSLELHDGTVNALAVDADSILTGGEDRRVHLLDRVDGAVNMTYTAFAKPPVAVALTGNVMSVLSADKRLARWGKGSADEGLAEYFFPSTPTAMTIAANGNLYVATQANGSNAVWVYNSVGLLLNWLSTPPNRGEISSMAVTPDGQHILTGRRTAMVEKETEMGETIEVPSDFHACQFWHLSRGSYSGSLEHSYSLNDARISADGTTLFTQSDRRVIRWGTESGSDISGTNFLETGYFVPYSFSGLSMTDSAAGLVGTRVRSSIYLMHAAERLLYMSVHTDCNAFDISPDGTRLITNTSGELTRFWDISVDFPTVLHENPVISAGVAYLPDNQSLGSVPDDQYVSIFNTSGLRYSGILVAGVSEEPDEPATGSQLQGPTVDSLYVSANGQRVAVVLRYEEKNEMSGESKSFVYLQVYGLVRDGEGAITPTGRLFEKFLGVVENATPKVAAALSHDGSLLFYGMAAPDEQGHLVELNTLRELTIFTPPSMGTVMNMGPVAAQFTGDSSSLMVAWSEGYASVYRREGINTLRVRPLARSVSSGDQVVLSADAVYADGSTTTVTDRTDFTVSPEGSATIDGATVTVADGLASGTVITVTATYEELGTVRTGTATLTVQDPVFTQLSIDPPKISLARGQSVDLHVFAHFASGQVIEVTADGALELVADRPDALTISGGTVTVNEIAQFGDVIITARLTRDGDERSVEAAVHIRHEGSMVNPGDFDESLDVAFNDLLYFVGHYGEVSTNPTWDSRCDFDGNNVVDFDDATTLFGLHGTDYHPTRGDGVVATNLLVASSDVPAAVNIWVEVPDQVQVGDVFKATVWAQENLSEANGFRGGPIDIRFDSELVALEGGLDPDAVLASPFNAFLTNGTLLDGCISQLGGLTALDGYGDGEPVLYATLTFRALQAGAVSITPCSGSCGIALTPPVSQVTIGSTVYGEDTIIIDLGGGGDGDGGEVSEKELIYELPDGWSLIGIPLYLAARRGGFDDLTFYRWNAGKRCYEETFELEPGKGYWVFTDGPKQLVLRGLPTTPQSVSLEAGWNLVAPHIESAIPPPEDVRRIYCWDTARKMYADPESIEREDGSPPCKPWTGYWLFTDHPTVDLWEPDTDTNDR